MNITIFDLLGKEIETLVNDDFRPGSYQAEWNGEKYSSGIYFYRMTTGNFVQTRKMLLIK